MLALPASAVAVRNCAIPQDISNYRFALATAFARAGPPPFAFGLAFAFGWTPCLGPILSAILAVAADQGSTARGTMLLGFYAIGLGIPFLLSAIFLTRAMGLMSRIKRHMVWIERAMGALLVAVGLALISGSFTRFSWWLLETFPALQTFG